MKSTIQCLIILMLAAGQSKAQSLIDVLIIDGFSNHDWKHTTAMTKQILEESGLFKVSVSTISLDNDEKGKSWRPDFSAFDVVIQNTNNIHNKDLKWPEKIEKKLENYVLAGGSLYILHSANNAFPHWEEYNRMIGLGWRPKETGYALEIDSAGNIVKLPPGTGENTYHGKRIDVVINRLHDHPINDGFPEQWLTPSLELYKYARGPAENLTVLSYAHDTTTHKNWPVEWVVRYGKGSVYNSSMGHLWKDDPYPISFRCIGFQTTMIRATEWLGSGRTTYSVPENFPTKETIRVREVQDFQKNK